MKSQLLLAGFLLSLVPAVTLADHADLEIRRFTVLPRLSERVTENTIDNWMTAFGHLGVDWPDGSSIKFLPQWNKLVVRNTRENLRLMKRLLLIGRMLPFQIEVQVDFIEFKMTDVDELARRDELSASSLLDLWRQGGAKLLYTPRVTTQSGIEAVVKAVTEYIYPTEFKVTTQSSTSSQDSIARTGAAEPSLFQTREVGVILRCVPRLSPEGEMINIAFNPEIVQLSEWKNYGSRYETDEGQKEELAMEQPFFHSLSFLNDVYVANGATVMIAGGMNNRVGDNTVFAFLTARLVDIEGNPIITEAETGEQ